MYAPSTLYIHPYRYYGNGKLKDTEMITYVQHHALLWEYYRQGKEIMPPDIKPILDDLYEGSNFNTLAKGYGAFVCNIQSCAEKRNCFAKHQPGVAGCGWLQPG